MSSPPSPPSLSDLRIDRSAASSPPPRGRVALWIGLIVLAIVIAGGWILAQPRTIAVRVATAGVSGGAQAGGNISANGYVVARTKASVSAKTAGRMEYLGVHEGSRVRRGEVLARIESNVYRAQLDAANAQTGEIRAQLVQAQRDLERSQALLARNLIAQADLENAETKVEVLKATLRNAEAQQRLAAANVENTLVRAPFDGTVLRKDAEVGEIVEPASAGGGLARTAIVTMADLATLEVEVDVNEAYIAQIGQDQAARITLDAYPDTSFVGRVRQVVPTADREKATVLVKVSILDRDPRILPEMGSKVVFLADSGRVVAPAPVRVTVPSAAVVRDAGGARVWVVENGRAAARTVELGRQDGDQVEVRSGLAGGETVVVQPPAGLTSGARVRAASS